MPRQFIFRPAVIALLVVGAYASTTSAAEKTAPLAEKSTPTIETTVSEAYVRLLARNAYFWGWPMANIYNRRVVFSKIPQPSLLDGILPVAPLNRLSMLADYIDPMERHVACPNQDVVYGGSVLALDKGPVVVQVPDFGDRYWVYQAVDIRTDSFAELGKQYGTKPGFYLLVGPEWKGKVPAGITKVFRSSANTGMFIPRAFQSDSPDDKKITREVISGIDMYPLAEFTGKMKKHDWSQSPALKSPNSDDHQQGETHWVKPEAFFDELPIILADSKPLAGEEVMYQQMNYLKMLAKTNPEMREVMIDEAKKTESELISPLLSFSSFGIKLAHHWSTIDNGAEFGNDYYTRTAVARSNILVNKNNETKYFYSDADNDGKPLTGDKKYTLTLPKGTVPVKGFWSLTLYNSHHFFVPNDINRYSLGTKTPDFKYNADGSLTLYIQPDAPSAELKQNWLPSPKSENFSLYIRAYWPTKAVLNGEWLPPAVLAQ